MISIGIPRPRTFFWDGNSLSVSYAGDWRIVLNCYSVARSGIVLAYRNLAVSGKTQTTINNNFSTKMSPELKRGDICVCWEGTNDMHVNSLSGADAYAKLLTYAQSVRDAGASIVVGTVIARDYVDDDADLMDRIDDYNTLIRNNSNEFDAVADLGGNSVFDSTNDASNTTYYQTDKIHIKPAAEDVIIPIFNSAIATVL